MLKKPKRLLLVLLMAGTGLVPIVLDNQDVTKYSKVIIDISSIYRSDCCLLHVSVSG